MHSFKTFVFGFFAGLPKSSAGDVQVRVEHLPQQTEGTHWHQVGRQEQERNLPQQSLPGLFT